MKESAFQREVRLLLGSQPDLLLLRNNVGTAREVDERTGEVRFVKYGLMEGSSDLVGALKPHGRWFCLELKKRGGKTDPGRREKQKAWRELIRGFGGFADVVDCTEDALAALDYAREGHLFIPKHLRNRQVKE